MDILDIFTDIMLQYMHLFFSFFGPFISLKGSMNYISTSYLQNHVTITIQSPVLEENQDSGREDLV